MLVGMAEKGGEGGWDEFRRDWKENEDESGGASDGRRSGLDVPDKISGDECVWSVWSKDFVTRISHAREVENVIALGSVLAISLHASGDAAGTSPLHFPLPSPYISITLIRPSPPPPSSTPHPQPTPKTPITNPKVSTKERIQQK
jgi:hypothetical protein